MEKPNKARTVLQRYRRMLVQNLNRSVDRLERLFIAAEVTRKEAEASLSDLRHMLIQVNAKARRSEWLMARAQGRRMASKRREAVLWEVAYQWQEFLIFFHCHWPIRRH